MPSRAVLASLLLVLLTAAPAAGWELTLPEHDYGPSFFLAVDKASQSLFVMRQQSPLTVEKSFSCTTGQILGDKLVEGDMRTPEGVYFVTSKLAGGLDYQLYGDMAFTLDFPNPVDRLKGKTGHGIWIHGRGSPIVPRETKGCVALNTPDLRQLDPRLAPGTPVVIARALSWPPDKESRNADAETLARRVKEWAKAWRSRSDAYFSFFDADSFQRSSGTPFDSFEDYKRRIFSAVDWVLVEPMRIRAIPGPDYWVTVFDQFYLAPGYCSQIEKRLYWMRGDDGEWRIVGRETGPERNDLADAFLGKERETILSFVESWRAAWERGRLDDYLESYAPEADQQGRVGVPAIAEHKRRLWRDASPARVAISEPRLGIGDDGIEVRFRQDYEAAGNYADSGYKTLVLRPEGDGWRIARESWSKTP